MTMKLKHTPLNIEQLKKKHYYKRDRRFDLVMVVIGLFTIGVHIAFISVLLQRQAPMPIASVDHVQENILPTVTPYRSQLAKLANEVVSENTLGVSTSAQFTSTPSSTIRLMSTPVKGL